jgi:hypothetical protein
MLAIAVFAVITVAAFVATVAAALIVTIGVHQEERRMTFTRQRAPSTTARLARLIVGHYVRRTDPEPGADLPGERVPWFGREI